VQQFATLGPLARRAADEAEVVAAMPGAHHFGGR
jgi:hypothetical protein